MFTAESGWMIFACGFRLVPGKHDPLRAGISSLDGVSSDDVLQGLADKLATLLVPKRAIGWELEQLEEATRRLAISRTTSDSDDESTE
jgi:hypothetical protein